MMAAPLRVLVVDDDEEDFLILRDLLADFPKAKFTLEWAPTLADGIRHLRAGQHDVYLVDYLLGPDNGLDLVRLAVAEGSAHRPVIMLTGHGNADVDREALDAGAADYLVKGSIDGEKLARSLRYAAERARQVGELEESKQRYRQLFDSNPFPSWVYDVGTRRFVTVNAAMLANYGYDRDELMGGMTIADIRSPDEAGRLSEVLKSWDGRDGYGGIWQHRRKDGSVIWAEISTHCLQIEGRDCRLVIANDITERHRVEAELAYTSSHDALTGLPRFQVLEALLADMLVDGGAPVTMFYIDIDRFHAINESMGHLVGDEALHVLAERMSRALGGSHNLSRFAGDEFVTVARGLDSAQSLALAERLRATVAQPIEGDGYRLFLTASVGISRSPEHGETGMELLRRAEAAMTRAKREGRDSAREFSVDQMQELEDRLVLGGRLRLAIGRGELSLHYQPQLDAASRRITGLEALVRWTSPDMGPVPPGRFIPIAETLGLMPEVGTWVLNEACRQLRVWLDQGHADITVAINFSAQQLQRPDVCDLIRDALHRHGVPAKMLEIELTESSLMENVERVQDRLAELKALGLSLSLDDFGTGYSSLSYLREFSLDKLKIDRSFVQELPDNADDAVIARTIVAMAHQLRLVVAAEGVETAEQATFLSEIGCDELQGYHFGRPVPAAEIDRLLASR